MTMLKFFAVEDESKLSELMIYIYIDATDCFLNFQNSAKMQGKIAENSWVDAERAAREDQQALIRVLISRDEFDFADHHEYLKWYRWWRNWHKSVLTDQEWNILNCMLKNDLCDNLSEDDLLKWRPKGNWRDS